jgi:glutamine synthetase adenylyltransferase
MAALLREARNKKREVVSTYAVKDLENVWKDNDTLATLSDVVDLVWALPDDVFDELWQFVEDPNNFRERAIEGSPAELAGK